MLCFFGQENKLIEPKNIFFNKLKQKQKNKYYETEFVIWYMRKR